MKKMLLGTLFLALASIAPNQAVAEVNISIGVSLPPLIRFQAPPDVIVIPDTDYVYAVPGIDVDMYFWNGFWWRLWEGRWYRSHYYDRGWGYYGNVPSFYFDVDPGWRTYYRDRNWYGHRWDYQRIPYRSLQQNWRSWNTNHYWERRGTWGVQNYQPRPRQQRQELRQQRQIQYQQRPEVQRFQQQRNNRSNNRRGDSNRYNKDSRRFSSLKERFSNSNKDSRRFSNHKGRNFNSNKDSHRFSKPLDR